MNWEKMRSWDSAVSGKEGVFIKTIDMHAAGEPARIVIDGFPQIKGSTMLEKRAFVKERLDHLRTSLMFEPRGHADMYGCLITEPSMDEADFGIIFMHNEGYSTMCGHATIAVTKLAVELGWVPATKPATEIRIEAPCGLITSRAIFEDDKIVSVEFENVPSFVYCLNHSLALPGLGEITYDIAFGGAFYAFVDADKLQIPCTADHYQELITAGKQIKLAIVDNEKIQHPFESDLGFLYGTIFVGGPVSEGADSRNVCVFANGEVDRSPTGSGVSARMALHYSKKEIGINQPMIIESILGTTFRTWIKDTCRFGGYDAILPVVQGDAYITGSHIFYIDPEDPLKEGFILR